MRILVVDTCYPGFLAAHYGADPQLASRPYAEQWDALMRTRFATSDAYSHNLRALGHEAHEVIANCPQLRQAWLRKEGLDESLPWADTVVAQARAFAADVVYVQNLHVLPDATLDALRALGPLVAGQIASAAPPAERLRRFDLLLTSFPHFVERFRAVGVAAEYFRIGFDERVPAELGSDLPRHDIVFVGTLNGLRHRRGNATLARAARSVPVDFYGHDLRGWLPGATIRRRYRGEAWGLDMLRLLAGARIVLNRHIAEAEGYANNMRLYEATGVGALLLTDERSNLHELFEPGREVVTYSGSADLAEKARHLLAHEDERAAIAAAGQARTLRDHTYRVRMQELATILQRHLP